MITLPSPDQLKAAAKIYRKSFPDCEKTHCQVLEMLVRDGGFNSWLHYLSVFNRLRDGGKNA